MMMVLALRRQQKTDSQGASGGRVGEWPRHLCDGRRHRIALMVTTKIVKCLRVILKKSLFQVKSTIIFDKLKRIGKTEY